ncbi:MAG: ATP-binding cassette domain-containing protein [Nitrospinaceae bacterium]|nr:ATP-binding cassette domain-containing protein [Nitrospinaceae bacterium]NIR54322.1 ATP-binding cassette domain-containing protein [Nitrospinaceae bacterium]NIS84740.1 ATP-binding cassette domain-containing protein [Nitrospinaceae bacterium]NIT81541.1 ATP-binding cassette domain-containing protein [Nitrospinaceae bacterium]NIU43826.1 ATP-binding cassette domain-containing protein [Nitrospinaceae bacterium]
MSSFLVQIKNASVYLGDTRVLKSIDWTVRPNESWALVGNNGSGKTTLLKLIFGELLPIEGGQVHWFGNREWTGLADVREKVGYVSAEYQQNYDQNVSGLQVVESGFFASIGLWDPVSAARKKRARECLHLMEIEHLADKPFYHMSYGESRRVLLARALVHRPALLILDEPCAGLDIPTRERFLATLQKLPRKTRMIYVTHHIEEILPAVSHVLYLKEGTVFRQGAKEAMLEDKVLSEALGYPLSVRKNNGRYWLKGP